MTRAADESIDNATSQPAAISSPLATGNRRSARPLLGQIFSKLFVLGVIAMLRAKSP